ncbi:hypothetical protein QU661_00085 [Mogibacterium neglectum]|uniref:type III-A CRISPR-associated CARF protein Csm6 n=1 Tax=Mogibacterium neglectum TaxID=114528 RepID=UPI00272ADF85|nr:hypothetical protein [Mogibacterium neglectum]WLD76278.1 hypothetical protein QU661_00085 [Mogibacterium neglectum]
MKRILFSPVGSTDPISSQRDGALLHIIRVYRPDKVILFLSKEINGYENKDNRYSYCLNRLQNLIGKQIEFEWMIRDELVNVHLFDPILLDFKEILEDLCDNIDEDDELFLNISSGSPAMKSALQTLTAFTERPMIPIQVSSPNKEVNTHEDVKGDYDVELQWELNLDNSDEPFKNRCEESPITNLSAEIRKSIIKKHIEAYDYVAALDAVGDDSNYISKEAILLMEAGAARLKLDKVECDKKAKTANYDIYPIKQGDHWNIFEYLMIMRIKLEKEEYADYIRSMSPVYFKLLEMIIEKNRIENLKALICYDKKTGGTCWQDKEKGYYVKSVDYINIICKKGQGKISDASKKTIIELRYVEENARNTAAHNISCITDEFIYKVTQMRANQILEKLCELARYVGIKITDNDLKTYDKLNEKIISLL